MTIAEDCARAADGLTVPGLLARNAEQFADLPALSGGDRTLTWARLRSEVLSFAAGLAGVGLAAGDRMLIMMSNRPEHWIADLAAAQLAAIPCTAYATLSSEQIGFVAGHSAATVVVLEGQSEVDRWLPVLDVLPALRKVIVLAEIELPEDERFVRWADLDRSAEVDWPEIKSDDPVAMMYTSGTTGDPKGVVLSHRNVIYETVAVDAVIPLPMHGDSIAYLPLAHIAERELGIYGALSKAAHVTTCADPNQVVGSLVKVRPVSFFGVPRVWEKMAAALQGAVAASDEQKRAAFAKAHGVGLQAYRLRAAGQPVPEDLAAQQEQLDALVLKPIRAMLGLDNMKWAASGAAPIPVAVLEFFGGLGIDILEVWGMSETTGSATASTPEAFRPGKVGRTIPGIEVRIAEDGEILVRGPIVFLGYLQADGSVVSTVDADGWLATGDVGTLDDEGFLTITDRKKELIITSSGKNIAPTKLEGLLRAHPKVGNAIVIGDRRPYVTALITLEDGVDDAGVQDELDALVASVNSQVSRPEQIKKYLVLPTPWTPEGGELTPTLKLRRKVVHERYAEAIEGLYEP